MIKYFAALAALLSSVQAQYTISRVAGSRLELGMSPTAVYVVYPTRLTYDSAGRFYFMAENRIFRVSGGVVDLVIGGGTYGLGGEGGLATAATVQLRFPSGLAVDRFNNLYILDYTVVRKVDATTGIITTVAGPGPPAGFFLGDGGPATSASFASSDIAVDFEGNLYIADSQHARVRKVAVGTGIISTVAGNGNSTESGDGGPATSAGVVGSRLALDTAGNLYLGGKYRVRKVTASTGIITTIAGTGTDGLTGDGGPAILATLGYPFSIGTDSSGNIYVSCHDGTIRKVTAAGIISTIAGTGGLATQATVDPEGRMAVDAAGNILYSQSNDSLILRIDGSTNIITTVAGTTDALGDNGPASLAQFAEASGIASDAAGNIYIADAGARRVRKISATTGTITTIAGNGKIGSDGDGGLATNAAIVSSSRSVLQIAVDPVNDLYLADDSGNIRRVSSQTGIISTVVTNPNLANPGDLIVDSSGIYVTIQNLVRVDPVSGSLKELSLTTSSGIDRDAFGNFYLTNRSTIHKVSGGSETTVAGNCVAQTCPDSVFFTGAQLGDGGLAVDATLNRPYGVKVDHSGNLLIADIYDMRVRLVSASTGKISTIAGTNVPGCSGQGPATSARLIAPFRFGLDGTGNIYVLDAGCKQLFKLSPPSPSYAGNLDIVNCQTISGWAADRSRLGQSITVSIYDGSTLLGTVTANQLRSDVGSLLGDSGLHGFSLPLPASVRDGTPHSLHAVFESTSVELGGLPRALTCGAAVIYTGSVDSSSCSGITGWAADRNRPNVAILVSLWDGASLVTSSTANLPRSDVGSLLGDNGLHGFSLAVPPGYANGVNHVFQVRYESSSTQLSGSPTSLICGGVIYAGYVDAASCTGITGWVADRNRPGTPIVVSLWSFVTQIASTTANGSRSDVGAALGDNGLHGFTLSLPASYVDTVTHQLQVRFESSAVQVPGTAVSLTCSTGGTVNYVGHVDVASCSGISGWVADTNRLNTSIAVSLWDGTTRIGSTGANASRGDVSATLGDNGLHGFTLPIPAAYANGVPHSLQVHYEYSATTSVAGSPVNLTCKSTGTANYAGNVDVASCTSGISGWAADLNRLNTPITVSLWDGATQIGSTTANGSRADVGPAIGDGGLHGFNLPIPAAYANGVSHALQVHYESGATQVTGASTTLTCGAAASPNYAGAVDVLSCSSIAGWAADRNSLNSSVSINIYDGATLLLTTPANASRPDVGAYLNDSGLHGFGVATPASLKDGKAHTITIKPGSSSTPLQGVQGLTCLP